MKAKKINLKSSDSVDTDAEMEVEEKEDVERARLGKLSLREVFQHSGESEEPPRSGDRLQELSQT